jgi:hypothetical protein
MSWLLGLLNPAARAAARDRERRIQALHADVAALRDAKAADATAFDRVRGRPADLGLAPEDVELEMEWLDGLQEAAVLRRAIEGGEALPVVATSHRAVAGDRCHFVASASRPDDAHDRGGKLFLTERRLLYLGDPSIGVGWPHVVAVASSDRDVVVRARSDRLLRFRCNSYSDALRCVVIASRLLPALTTTP